MAWLRVYAATHHVVWDSDVPEWVCCDCDWTSPNRKMAAHPGAAPRQLAAMRGAMRRHVDETAGVRVVLSPWAESSLVDRPPTTTA